MTFRSYAELVFDPAVAAGIEEIGRQGQVEDRHLTPLVQELTARFPRAHPILVAAFLGTVRITFQSVGETSDCLRSMLAEVPDLDVEVMEGVFVDRWGPSQGRRRYADWCEMICVGSAAWGLAATGGNPAAV